MRNTVMHSSKGRKLKTYFKCFSVTLINVENIYSQLLFQFHHFIYPDIYLSMCAYAK